MNDFKMCGLAICGVMLCMIFKNTKNEYSLFVRLGVSIIITLFSFSLFIPILTYIEEITRNTAVYSYIPTLIKAFGIAVAVQITADISRDAGEEAISNKIVFFGKIQILILSMPLIKSLFSMCKGLL